jgi:hypothetical protein
MSAASLTDETWDVELPPELPRETATGSYAEIVAHGSSSYQISNLTQGTARTGRAGADADAAAIILRQHYLPPTTNNKPKTSSLPWKK